MYGVVYYQRKYGALPVYKLWYASNYKTENWIEIQQPTQIQGGEFKASLGFITIPTSTIPAGITIPPSVLPPRFNYNLFSDGIVFPGNDTPGTSYFPNSNISSCGQKCSENSSCNYFQINTNNNDCYLKSRVLNPDKNSAYTGILTYTTNLPNYKLMKINVSDRGAANFPIYNQPLGDSYSFWFSGVTYNGNDISVFGESNIKDCAAKCSADSRCNIFELTTDTDTNPNTCYLKTKAANLSSSANKWRRLLYTKDFPNYTLNSTDNDYPDNSIPNQNYPYSTLNNCIDICTANPLCNAIVHDNNNKCILKYKLGQPTSNGFNLTNPGYTVYTKNV